MHLTSYIGIGLIIISIVMIFFILRLIKRNNNNKPYSLSLVALALIILNWLLYLFDFYAVIPEKIGELIFLPIWILVSVIGLIAAYKEFRNNRIFSIVNSGLSIISFIVAILAWGIGNM